MPDRRELDVRPPAVADSAGSAAAELDALRSKALACRNCDLWRNATQTVFGEGPVSARLMLVGEQPGDQEDRQGHPFVGPAGGVLDRALDEAGVDRSDVYLTNAVKHFRWRPSGGGARRIHDKPNWTQIGACFHWLEREIELVEPSLLVALGATAGQAILGRTYRVTRDRGQVLESAAGVPVIGTIHPSAVLRAADDATRRQQFGGLVDDLRTAVRAGGAS